MESQQFQNHPDLKDLVAEALRRVANDPRRVWYKPAIGYDSRVELKKLFLLGGAHCPAYLTREPDRDAGCYKLPYVFSVAKSRILFAESLEGDVTAWVPFLENVHNAKESLIVVTPRIANELLAEVFITNTRAGNVDICPVRPTDPNRSLEEQAEKLAPVVKGARRGRKPVPYLRAGDAPAEDMQRRLPLAPAIHVRRDAAIVFPGDEEAWTSVLCDVAMIHVGGREREDQQNRLLAVAETLFAMGESSL